MTRETFYRNLKRLTKEKRVVWRVTEEGKIRTSFKGRMCSPLTFVAYAKNGKRYNIFDPVVYLQQELDLSKKDAVNIALATEFDDSSILGNTNKIRQAIVRNIL